MKGVLQIHATLLFGPAFVQPESAINQLCCGLKKLESPDFPDGDKVITARWRQEEAEAKSKLDYMIKLISACNSEPAYAELARMSQASIKKYCRKHSYKHAFHLIEHTERHINWYKIKCFTEEFRKGDADYYLWLDADTLIWNHDFDLRTLTRSGKDIYIAKDDLNINCGVMLLKNSDFNRQLMEKIWSMTHCLEHVWMEQQALIELIEANYEGIHARIEYVPQKVFNAYMYGLYGKRHEAGEFDLDSFVVHFPGMPVVTRRWKMLELSKPKQVWKRRRLKLRRFFARLGLGGNSSAVG